MKRLAILGALGIFVFSGTLQSCKKQVEEQVMEVPTDYDKLLMDALDDSSNGQGLNYFILPESHDYGSIPQDPLNPISAAKVDLGKLLFHETGLAREAAEDGLGTETYSCASCHHAQGGFQANMQQGIGEGGIGFGLAGEGREFNPAYNLDDVDVQPVRTPSALNSAYQEANLWNGQFGAVGVNEGTQAMWDPELPTWNNNLGHHGVETQAIAGLTVHRMVMDEEVCLDYELYEDLFDIVFSDWTTETRYSAHTAGLAIAAYERTLLSNQAPFQLWLQGDMEALSDSEKRGAALFFGKAECNSCHTGPALNTMTFYALGMNDMEGNGTYGASSDNEANKGRASFTQNPDDEYKFKTPQLYNLTDSPFYGHGGTFNSVREVIEYKNSGLAQNPNVPSSQLADEFVPLNLTDEEITDLVNFIEDALYDPNLMRYVPDELPSGNCFPNNDAISVIDQGCIQ